MSSSPQFTEHQQDASRASWNSRRPSLRRSRSVCSTVIQTFVLALAGSLATAPLSAQDPSPVDHPAETGAISGRVIDEDTRRPIEDVAVRVADTQHETLSDERGMFRLSGVPAGEHRLLLEHLSYGEHARGVLVNEAENLTLEARMSTQAIELAPLLVEALTDLDRRRITTGAQINEVERPELDLAGRAGRGLEDLLREEIPGASMRPGRFGGACIEFRGARAGGGECRELTVFVDGVRIADPGLFYTTTRPDDVERMEILSPAEAGARYGSVSGNGVLLVETRRPPQRRQSADSTEEGTLDAGFDWTEETRPYAWKRVFATSFVANAVGVGLSLALADQCLWRTDAGSLGLRTRCGGVATTGISVLSLALPALGGSAAAQWGGQTDRSQGRITPTSLTAALGIASGYMLVIHGTGASEAIGSLVLGVGVPALTTFADRLFRSLR